MCQVHLQKTNKPGDVESITSAITREKQCGVRLLKWIAAIKHQASSFTIALYSMCGGIRAFIAYLLNNISITAQGTWSVLLSLFYQAIQAKIDLAKKSFLWTFWQYFLKVFAIWYNPQTAMVRMIIHPTAHNVSHHIYYSVQCGGSTFYSFTQNHNH